MSRKESYKARLARKASASYYVDQLGSSNPAPEIKLTSKEQQVFDVIKQDYPDPEENQQRALGADYFNDLCKQFKVKPSQNLLQAIMDLGLGLEYGIEAAKPEKIK